jgi:eukaryotic-like serine/threonine-protein kinase
MAPSNPSKIPLGTVLAEKYRLTRELGRGGMAAVYEAENVDIGKRVAVKVLAAELTTSTIVVERFLREARAAAAISSPYICDVYDSGKLEDGRPFLVLELLEGESLYERMTRVRQIDIPSTVRMVGQVARGLTKAHAAGIVHRDLKPENIFLTKDEEGNLLAKLLDFGLAKFYLPMASEPGQARLTREGAVFGTPAYMSPEQVKGQGQVDHRADLWALGCMTYECLTGRTVWSTEQGVAMTFAQIASAPLPNVLMFRPDLPPSFQAWFEKALARSVDARFQTAKELADELGIALADPTSGSISANDAIEMMPRSGSPRPDDVPSSRRPRLSPVAAISAPSMEPSPRPTPLGAAYAPNLAPPPLPPPPPPPDQAMRGGLIPPNARPSGGSPLSSTLDHTGDAATPRRRKRPGRAVLTLLGVGGITAGGYFGWLFVIRPSVQPIATAAISASSSAPTTVMSADLTLTTKGPKWAPLIASAQGQFAASNLSDALRMFKEASEGAGAAGAPRALLEQVQVAVAAKGPCKVTAISRPRPFNVSTPPGRPTLAFTPRGAVVAWTDDHESAGHDHAYTALLDAAMRSSGVARDVTPEGGLIARPQLFPFGDRVAMVYADMKGVEAGIHARWLDADGRIAAPTRAVTARKPNSNASPSIARAPDGTFWVAWEDDRQSDSSDLFLRHLSADLEPIGSEVRATDYVPRGGKPRARVPSVDVAAGFLNVAFRFEREPFHLVELLRIGLLDPALPKGLDGLSDKQAGRDKDRELGDVKVVNTDREKADTPRIDCVTEGCFLVWHGENGGAFAAYMEASKGQILWRKKFDSKGGHPTLAIAPSGAAELAWFEGGRLKIATITRDGVGLPTPIARATGDPPPPSLAPGGAPGEWYVTWLDAEAGHPELFGTRALCK